MIIDIKHLKKSFKDVKAVNDLSFSVREGELFAFLGVNGAGKSTTINIISGVLNKDEGYVEVCGCNLDDNPELIKSKIGIVFQNSVLDKTLTVYENLKCRANLYGIFGNEFKQRLEMISELLDLKNLLKRQVSKLSGGQKRRIDIARALIHNPSLLILDEPTTGLDPKTRIMVWDVIDKLRKENNLTVFLTTHYMEEAANADYVVILDGGVKVAEGTPHELKNKYANDFIKFYNHRDKAREYFKKIGERIYEYNDFTQVELKSTSEISKHLKVVPDIFDDFEVLKGNMDNVFLKVTGKDLSDV